jgi:hypothetical protein
MLQYEVDAQCAASNQKTDAKAYARSLEKRPPKFTGKIKCVGAGHVPARRTSTGTRGRDQSAPPAPTTANEARESTHSITGGWPAVLPCDCDRFLRAREASVGIAARTLKQVRSVLRNVMRQSLALTPCR